MDFYASFINLDHRKDRLDHMTKELERVGIQAERTRGLLPQEVNVHPSRVATMYRRTQGAIGCHFSQVSVMQKAFDLGKNALVMEDDLIFCSDIQERFKIMKEFTDTHEWDVIWLGGTFHVNPPYWHTFGGSQDMRNNCSANLGYDAKRTDHPRFMRTYGSFSTHAYIVNYHSIKKVLKLLDANLESSIGIDWLFIKLSPQLHTYAFVPGCCRQMDNQSDIGNGITYWSGFLNIGPYVWKDRMGEFDPNTFNWHEAS